MSAAFSAVLLNNRQLLQSGRYDENKRVLTQVRRNDLVVCGYCREEQATEIPAEIANCISMYHLLIHVELVAVEGTCKVTPMNLYNSGYSLVATSSFPTRRSDICVPKKLGKYYYEFIVDDIGGGTHLGQIGWMTEKCSPNDGWQTGVGDDRYSWAFDGGRQVKWHKGREGKQDYGKHWAEGDVVGCCIEVSKLDGQWVCFDLSYSLNGNSLGVAFKGCKYHWNSRLYAAFSTQRNRTNGTMVFDKEEFEFMPDGYGPIY